MACSDTADTSVEDPAPAALAGDPAIPADSTRSPSTARHDSPTERTCGITERTVLTPQGIGDLRVGLPVAQARARCRVLRDSIGELEGMPAPMLLVDLGRDTIVAERPNDSIWRLRVDSPAFRTHDGLGVGSTIAELRARGSARVARGEGTFILLDEKCGLSFALGDPRIARALPARISARDLPQDMRVVSVLVYGCHPVQPVAEGS